MGASFDNQDNLFTWQSCLRSYQQLRLLNITYFTFLESQISNVSACVLQRSCYSKRLTWAITLSAPLRMSNRVKEVNQVRGRGYTVA